MKNLPQGLLCALLTFTLGVGVVKVISYPYLQQEFHETILRQDLYAMRKAINQYTLDHENRPQSLNDLVNHGYIREIPLDPMTNRPDWDIEFIELKGMYGSDGIVDIHSSSSEVSIFGIPYHEF